MTNITFGEVEWETVELPGEGKELESDFMILEEGDNRGRVLSKPQQFAVHWVQDEVGKKRKVNCANLGCPVCQRGQDGDKPQRRWLVKFLSRKANKVKLLEISSQVLKGLKELVSNPDWGPVTEYDVNIKRGAPGSQPLYTVMPGRRAPLTNEEKQMLADFKVDISKFTTPPSPAVVAEKLGWTLEDGTKAVTNEFKTTAPKRDNGASVKPGSAAAKKPLADFDFDS